MQTLEINLTGIESISYQRNAKPLAFDLSYIARCYVAGNVFGLVNTHGTTVTYALKRIVIKQKKVA